MGVMTDEKNAIEVRNLKKGFKVYFDKGSTIKEKLVSKNRRKYEKREVLRGISFSVKKGEAIGLIGHNGCGKSTTLKLLSRIMYPDSGQIEMRGRVSSLIELGAGFHPDMSGRENIYINASIFGLTRKEIDRRLNDIIEFSELEEFIDNPVRTYSSGMYMRLAFSVAINVDADILLVDEILAVGDINFQEKCFDRMREIKAMGTTIVIVSHSLPQIEQICERTIWIDGGVIRDEGIPKYVHEHYLKEMENKRLEILEREERKKAEEKQREKEQREQEAKPEKEKEDPGQEKDQEQQPEIPAQQPEQENIQNKPGPEEKKEELPPFCSPLSIRIGNKKIQFTDVKLMDTDGKEKTVFKSGESFVVQMDYKSDEQDLLGNFGIGIFRDDGVHAYGTNTLIEHDSLVPIKEKGRVVITVTDNCLLPARYMLDVAIHSKDGIRYDDIRNIIPFRITANKKDIGLCRLDNFWTVDGRRMEKREYED